MKKKKKTRMMDNLKMLKANNKSRSSKKIIKKEKNKMKLTSF